MEEKMLQTDGPTARRSGPLSGIRVLEIAGLGPGPFAAMLLGDLGADVVRIERPPNIKPGLAVMPQIDIMARSRRSVALELKHPQGLALALDLVERADVLIEGFRPGVMERLGLGPEVCVQRNPRLIYGRMTGYGQSGPLAQEAGHDINYLALSGTLAYLGTQGGKPLPPLNLLGDLGGGGMLLAFGVCAALVERSRSGAGQVVDAAMVDGVATLSAFLNGMVTQPDWGPRGSNWLDGGAYFYNTYETADGGHVAVGAVEPQFHAALMRVLGLADEDLPHQMDRSRWPEMRDRVAARLRTRTRDEWAALAKDSDACLTPILDLSEAQKHPHNIARGTFAAVDGIMQPTPAPRFSRTPGHTSGAAPAPGAHAREVFADWGLDASASERLDELGGQG
jgi:alpha-methylacyl-CoA racemase